MALGDTNISVSAVRTETGNSSYAVSTLVGQSGLSKYSRYAPGTLGVDTNKDVTITPPTSVFKLGDFRRYNHSAIEPGVTQNINAAWGPGGNNNANIGFTVRPEELNIACFSSNGIDTGTTPHHYHLTAKAYADNANRANETNVLATKTCGVNMVAHTPLTGHTRQMTYVPGSGPSTNLDRDTGAAPIIVTPVEPSGDCYRYLDIYISDASGNRLINFGVKANGYTTCNVHEFVNPKLYSGDYFTPVPSAHGGNTWTFISPIVDTTSNPCTETSPITLTYSANNANFCVKAKGLCGNYHQMPISSCDVKLRINNNASNEITVATGVALGNESGYFVNNADVGRAWAYHDYVKVRLANVTYGDSALAYDCGY